MAERACLESMYIRKGIVGSNPTLSAMVYFDSHKGYQNKTSLRMSVVGFESRTERSEGGGVATFCEAKEL